MQYNNSICKKSVSIINYIFTSTFYSEFICKKCKFINQTIEPFNMLQLSINDALTLSDSLDNYFKDNEMEDFTCSLCRAKAGAIHKTYLSTTNNVIIIQLKRFTNEKQKISKLVECPFEISFDKYCYTKTGSLYELYGVINHSGILSGGHYSAYTKNPINNKWYEFNDSCVINIKDDDVKDDIITYQSYILFYKKK